MMNNPTNDGGPAFPVVFDHGEAVSETTGMTLRDYFAGQYLNGIAAGLVIESTAIRIGILARERGKPVDEFIASMAYDAADAMIAMRNKK